MNNGADLVFLSSEVKKNDYQESIMQTFNPESKKTQSFTIYPMENDYEEKDLIEATSNKQVEKSVKNDTWEQWL